MRVRSKTVYYRVFAG